MKTLIEIFPNASPSFQAANPQLSRTGTGKANLTATSTRRRGSMNKTESEFSLILEAMKRKGEILRYEYEGITLRWAGIRYTPDFVVFLETAYEYPRGIRLIEIKGAFVGGKFERAVERFRHARTYWPEFAFEMMQKQKSGWKRII